MVLSIPRAAMDLDLLGRRILLQELADVNRREAQRSRPVSVQKRAIEISPESALDFCSAEPAAILAISPGGHECRKVTVLGSLLNLVLKPPGIEPGELRVGKLP